MYIDTQHYNKENLNDKDKAIVEELERMSLSLFNSEVVEDFVENKYTGMLNSLIAKEIITEFSNELKQQTEEIIVEFIVDRIESYS